MFWATQHQPVYLFGSPIAGKNVLSEQVAEALHIPFYYTGCLQQKYELEGFVNTAGEYQETEFYRAFTQGGLFLFDGIENASIDAQAAFETAAILGYYTFPKIGTVKAHKDFIAMASGARRDVIQNVSARRFGLDDSMIDKFMFIELN